MYERCRIILCECVHAGIIPPQTTQTVLAGLRMADVAFCCVPDLCGMAARRDPILSQAAASGSLRIAACHPRAVRWLFDAAGAPLQNGRVDFLNLRTQSPQEVLAALTNTTADAAACDGQPAEADDWMPWFPVIDRDRCTDCGQCRSFCLFGVYAVSGTGRVEVRHPDKCKTNCPACARVCPQVAIIFPKYREAPFNGEEVTEEHLKRETVKVDPAAIAAGDVYAKLRRRSDRFSKEPEGAASAAERRAALAGLRQQLDIPPDVIASLGGTPKPSSDGVCDCDCDCDGQCACSSDDTDRETGCRTAWPRSTTRQTRQRSEHRGASQ